MDCALGAAARVLMLVGTISVRLSLHTNIFVWLKACHHLRWGELSLKHLDYKNSHSSMAFCTGGWWRLECVCYMYQLSFSKPPCLNNPCSDQRWPFMMAVEQRRETRDILVHHYHQVALVLKIDHVFLWVKTLTNAIYSGKAPPNTRWQHNVTYCSWNCCLQKLIQFWLHWFFWSITGKCF